MGIAELRRTLALLMSQIDFFLVSFRAPAKREYPSGKRAGVRPGTHWFHSCGCTGRGVFMHSLTTIFDFFKIISLGTVSRPFGTLRDFFLGHYWTFYGGNFT